MATRVKDEILKSRRDYFIDKVKGPLRKALVILSNRYPEPTKENTIKPNTHVLLDIWEQFFAFEDNPGRDSMFKALRRLTTDEYEHDNYYSQRMDWFLEQLVRAYQEGRWTPSPSWTPMMCWSDPAVREARIQMIRESVDNANHEIDKRNEDTGG